MDDSKVFIIGVNGQLGIALKEVYPNAHSADIDQLDITDRGSVNNYDWSQVSVIINAAGYTNVDGAETPEGKAIAWEVNDEAVGYLADIANQKDLTLVHVSTAYVFDGQQEIYTEQDAISPLGEYAKSKAAGDEKAALAPKHYIVRTDSVIGEGKNFVRTMLSLAQKDISPTVVADQMIRPTFTNVLAEAVKFLLDHSAEYGLYNVTNEGKVVSWADFTRAVFQEGGYGLRVIDTTLAEYSKGKRGIAPRPLNSVLDLGKIEALGFKPSDWQQDLKVYVKKELEK